MNRAFTLIELLIVVAIIAILAAMGGGIAGRRAATAEFAKIIDGNVLIKGNLEVEGKATIHKNAHVFGDSLFVGSESIIEPRVSFVSANGYADLRWWSDGHAIEIHKEVIIENDLKLEGVLYVPERIYFGNHSGDDFFELTVNQGGELSVKRISPKAATAEWGGYK